MDITEYEELRDLALEGLELLRDASVERRAVLVQMSALADLIFEEMRTIQQRWKERRMALVAPGDLPEAATRGQER